jgi:hypothetical protein
MLHYTPPSKTTVDEVHRFCYAFGIVLFWHYRWRYSLCTAFGSQSSTCRLPRVELRLIGRLLREHALPAGLRPSIGVLSHYSDEIRCSTASRRCGRRNSLVVRLLWVFRRLLVNALSSGTSASGYVPPHNLWKPHPLCEDSNFFFQVHPVG